VAIIQALLIICFLLLLARFLINPRSLRIQAWKKIIGIVFVLVAIAFIVSPQQTNHLAHLFGVGRGADLLLYILTVAFIFTVSGQYLKNKQEEKRAIQLTRKIAILEANARYKR